MTLVPSLPLPFSGLFLSLFSREEGWSAPGVPTEIPWTPWNGMHYGGIEGKKHSYCALLANQKTSPTKISRNPPLHSAPPISLFRFRLSLLWNRVVSVGQEFYFIRRNDGLMTMVFNENFFSIIKNKDHFGFVFFLTCMKDFFSDFSGCLLLHVRSLFFFF